MPPAPADRLRRLALALPEAHEVVAWGESTYRVRNKLFAMYASAGNHHGAGRPAVWLKAPPGNQGAMVADAPDRFFVPPYVGPSGWVGVWLDRGCDWKELAIQLHDAWRLTAPKRLLAQHGAAPSATAAERATAGTAKRPRAKTPPTRTPKR